MYIAILVALFVAIDQFTKLLVQKFLVLGQNNPVIGDFLNFYYLKNTGAAFGILQNSKTLFTIITVVVLVFLIVFIFKHYKRMNTMFKFTMGLLIGGIIGNFIDRIRLSYVVDFISLKFFGYNFAVFNLADSFIVIGTILLIIMMILDDN